MNCALRYFVTPQVLDAADFGVPQTRKRLFLLCDRNRQPAAVVPRKIRHIAARKILDPEGTWKVTPLDNGRRASATLARAGRAIEALGKGVPFLIVYYGSDGSGGWQPLDRPLRTMTTLDRFALVTWHEKKPMMRMLQVPELQRAMGFDDRFALHYGSRRDQIRLLGNGVCPPVMKAIIGSLKTEAGAKRLVAAE
jgi:DNA (cytosine-5)-methyltransferase 1